MGEKERWVRERWMGERDKVDGMEMDEREREMIKR